MIDPRRTETAALADEHLAVRPGADVAVLAAVAAALLDDGDDAAEVAELLRPRTRSTALRARARPLHGRAGRRRRPTSTPTAIERLIADVRAHRGRLAVMCGTGTTMARDGILVEWLRWVLLDPHRLARSARRHALPATVRSAGCARPPRRRARRRRPRPGPASRPELARVVGQVPAVALADEIEAGHVRALVVTGGNPLTAVPRARPPAGRAGARSRCSSSSTCSRAS